MARRLVLMLMSWSSVPALASCGGPREAQTIELLRPAPKAAPKLDVEDAGVAQEPEPAINALTGARYVQCDIVHGQVLACAGPAEGRAVLEQPDGTFRGCDVTHGAVVTCGAHGGGLVAVFQGQVFLACRIAQGRIAGCLGLFEGPAVVEQLAGSHAHE